MPTTKIRCQGCNRTFTAHGILQHIGKTQRFRCRALREASQTSGVLSALANISDVDPMSSEFPVDESSLGDDTPMSAMQQLSHETVAATGGACSRWQHIGVLTNSRVQKVKIKPVVSMTQSTPLVLLMQTQRTQTRWTQMLQMRTLRMRTHMKFWDTIHSFPAQLFLNRVSLLSYQMPRGRQTIRPFKWTRQIQSRRLTWSSNAFHVAALALRLSMHIRVRQHTTQLKRCLVALYGRRSIPNVTGRLRIGPKCVAPHHRQSRIYSQLKRYAVRIYCLSYC
jgi:hypothetical protein